VREGEWEKGPSTQVGVKVQEGAHKTGNMSGLKGTAAMVLRDGLREKRGEAILPRTTSRCSGGTERGGKLNEA